MQSGLIAASHSSVGKAPYYRFRGSGLESMSGPSLFQKYHFYHFIIAASSLRLVIFSTANDDYVTITQVPVYSYRHNLISYLKTNIKRWFNFGLVAISSCSYIDVRGINSNIPVKPAILWKLISTCTIFKVILLHVCTTIQNKTTLDNISFSLSTIDRHSK